eukprot:379337-Rhodomonas_salina.1
MVWRSFLATHSVGDSAPGRSRSLLMRPFPPSTSVGQRSTDFYELWLLINCRTRERLLLHI